MAFFRSGPFSPLVLLATIILVFYQIIGSNGSSQFKASVVEIHPKSPKQGTNLTRKQAVDLMLENIDIYKEKAQQAARSGNEIVVFPEYGLFGIFGYDKYARRTDIAPFLEPIPDPQKKWNPCKERYPFAATEIQRELSCIAKNFGLYVVANVGEKVPCKKRDDSNCPNDGQYQYNTNVVYSSNGTLVAKYRKKHLFKESYYNSPAKTEVVTFRTPFGDFGLITSYDSLFKSPLVDLVQKKFTTNIVMPNAWKTSKPLFRAIQWNSALARGQKINLFVSTVHDGHCGSYGSGIYTPHGMKKFVSEPDDYSAKLLSVRVKSPVESDMDRFFSRPILPPRQSKTINYRMAVFNDEVTFKFLEFTKQRDNITVCHDRFCCQLNYDSSERIEKYGLGVYKGHVRAVGYLLGVEMCVVVRCDPKCGQPTERASTYFRTFELVGINFTTEYIYPQVLFTSNHEVELLPYYWKYENGKISLDDREEGAIHSASLMGRVYKEDDKDYRTPYGNRGYGSVSHKNHAHVGQCISVSITIVAFILSIIFSS